MTLLDEYKQKVFETLKTTYNGKINEEWLKNYVNDIVERKTAGKKLVAHCRNLYRYEWQIERDPNTIPLEIEKDKLNILANGTLTENWNPASYFIITDWMDSRAVFKKKMLEAKNAGNMDDFREYNNKQNKVKANTNSIYGASTMVKTPAFISNVDMGGSITAQARNFISEQVFTIERFLASNFTFENTNYTTSNLHNGDVFIYNNANESLYNGYKVRQGDLFIASGEEGVNGLIPSDQLTWVYVPSADEPLVEIGDTLGANKSNPNFSIFRGLSDELLTFEIATDDSLRVEAATTNKTKVVTLKHVATKKSNAAAISKTLEYGSNGSLEITIQDPTEIDSNGHILQVTPKTYTLKDTHAIIEAAPHAGNGNILTPVVKVDNVDTELAPITINSNTLAVECVNGNESDNGAVTAAQINVELQWGSF